MGTSTFRTRWIEVIANRTIRVGEEDKTTDPQSKTPRNQFQRDFDRIVFSSSFKRLQNKTQVFPLPGTAQVHNRLTHSLEVASVGRSLGSIVGNEIAESLMKENIGDIDSINFYRYELKDLILAACLAHDMGNPCFGHSGEAIVSDYFKELHEQCQKKAASKDVRIAPWLSELKKITTNEWKDLMHFEGNANTLRMLTTHYQGKLPGGLRLTYLTLASIMKYPWGAEVLGGTHEIYQTWENKYGFFVEQKDLVKKIANTLNLLPYESKESKTKFKAKSESQVTDKYNTEGKALAYRRHPFVYLIEAADDICYLIMDMEDAHKIGILSAEEVKLRFYALIKDLHHSKLVSTLKLKEIRERKDAITDVKEQIVYLRSKAINALTEAVAKVYCEREKIFLEGSSKGIVKNLLTKEYRIHSLQDIIDISAEKIYKHRSVSETMIAASKILPGLLDLFLPALLINKESYQRKKTFSIIDEQFTGGDSKKFMELSPYVRILNLLDYITGMTDEYIFELYRKLMGIERNHH